MKWERFTAPRRSPVRSPGIDALRGTIDRFAAEIAWLKIGKAPLLSELGRRLLARPFPAHAACRILIAYCDNMLAYPQFNAFLRYADRFAGHGVHFRAVPWSALDPDSLPPGLDALFLQSDYEPETGELEQLLSRLKARSPSLRIAYFDWSAPADIRFAERVEPWVCSYVKKSLLRDRAAYLVPTRGHTNLSDHFGERFGTENPPCSWTVPPRAIPKLVVGPSFSTAKTLIPLFERRQPPAGERPIDLHARIQSVGTPWYHAMREEAVAAVKSRFHDLRVASQGKVPKRQFMKELSQSKLCFSPFGYGEICLRDLEAVAAGAVIVKPDMSHVETDPNIYIPFETYIPVRWDLADLDARVREALADPARLKRMADRAFAVVREHLEGPKLLDQVQDLVGFSFIHAPTAIPAFGPRGAPAPARELAFQ